MPVFKFDFDHPVTHLDRQPACSATFTPTITSLELHADKLRRFNSLVQRVAPGKPGFTADQIAGAARRVLRAAMKGQDSAFVRARLRRAGEIRAALADPQWEVSPALLAPMRAILDYIDDDPIQLIPASVPVVGQLDDAILVEAGMDLLRGELDDYAEFCRYRTAEAANLGVAIREVAVDRRRWRAERQQELRLEQRLRRVCGSSPGGAAGSTQPGSHPVP